MTGWVRKQNNPFTKSKRLNDGELIHLIFLHKNANIEELNDKVYSSYLYILGEYRKSRNILLIAIVTAILSYYDVISAFNAVGVDVARPVLNHVALTFLSASVFISTEKHTKLSFARAWFDRQFDKVAPSGRAKLLLCYPEAFLSVKFLPDTIGYPKYIHPNSNFCRAKDISFVILVIVGLVIYLVMLAILWIGLAQMIWLSEFPSMWAARAVVIGAGLLVTMSFLMPTFSSWRRKYIHYGMSDTLGVIEGRDRERHTYYHRWIARVRAAENERGKE